MIQAAGNRMVVTGNVTLANVAALREAGLKLAQNGVTEVDLSQVTEVDSSAVSLLLEWARAGLDKGQPLRFINLPTNLTSLAQLYGVTDLIFQPAGS